MTQSSILHIYRTYFPDPPGGLQEAIRQIAFSTAKLGYQNQVFTLSKEPVPTELIRPEARVVREKSWVSPASCDIGTSASFKTFKQLASQVDILHYHFPWPFGDLLHLLSKAGNPTVMTYHSDVVRQKLLGKIYEPLMYAMLKRMRVIIATSPAYIDSSPVLSQEDIRKKVRVIPLGINEETYTKDVDDNVFSRCNIDMDTPYFLFLGVLRYYKGVSTLVSAAKSVNAQIVIAGSGPEQSALIEQARKEGASNIIFAGQVTEREKVALLKNCYAFVLPSHLRSEAFGVVLIEASMLGKPMISCEISTGTTYVNQHEETGLVVAPSAPDQLIHAMRTLLENEAETLRMGDSARKRYERYFSGRVMGQAYQSIYQDIIS